MILLLLLVEVMVLLLVLLNLSAAFDTIDHDNLFLCILEKYVGICGNALKLIKSYFSNRAQRVQIDDVLSDFASIICGVPLGSVLGPLKFCLYLLPMSAILKYHKMCLQQKKISLWILKTRLQGNMYDVVRGVLPHPLIWMISHALRTLHKYRVLEAH